MIVGQQVTFTTHQYGRAQARLHALLAGQVVAEETAEGRIFEQWVCRLAHQFGGVQVGHCRRCGVDGLGIGHRAFLQAAVNGRLYQLYVLAGQADPLRVALDQQQCKQHADQQGPTEKTQCLGHRDNPEGCGGQIRPLRWRIIVRCSPIRQRPATACEESSWPLP